MSAFLMLCAAIVSEQEAAESVAELRFSKPDTELGRALNEQESVYLDRAGKKLWLKTRVARQTGVLEMFLCKAGTKEHESIVSVDSPAYVIHAGLLALGMEPGKPALFEPKFAPPQGQELEIIVHWTNDDGKARARIASDWIRSVTHRWFAVSLESEAVEGIKFDREIDLRYLEDDEELIWFGPMSEKMRDQIKEMSANKRWREGVDELYRSTISKPFNAKWIFAGSGFWVDETTGERAYLAESGNIVCVANFGDAMIDVDIQSSADNNSLLYEPWTERVPAIGTPVLVEIRAVDDGSPFGRAKEKADRTSNQ